MERSGPSPAGSARTCNLGQLGLLDGLGCRAPDAARTRRRRRNAATTTNTASDQRSATPMTASSRSSVSAIVVRNDFVRFRRSSLTHWCTSGRDRPQLAPAACDVDPAPARRAAAADTSRRLRPRDWRPDTVREPVARRGLGRCRPACNADAAARARATCSASPSSAYKSCRL